MISTSEVSYHRSTQGVRCLNVPEATLLKERERENSRLRQAVFDLTLDELILQKAPDPAQVLAIADKAGGRLGKARGRSAIGRSPGPPVPDGQSTTSRRRYRLQL